MGFILPNQSQPQSLALPPNPNQRLEPVTSPYLINPEADHAQKESNSAKHF